MEVRSFILKKKDYNESKQDNESYENVADNKDDDLEHFHEDKNINLSLNEIRKIENKFDSPREKVYPFNK